MVFAPVATAEERDSDGLVSHSVRFVIHDDLDNAVLVGLAEVGVEGQAQDLAAGLLGVGKVFLGAGQMGKDRLGVQRLAVVDGAGDASGLEGLAERFAVFRADGVLGVDVGISGQRCRGLDTILQGLGVAGPDLLAEGDLLVAEIGKLRLDNRGLQGIAAAVGAEQVVGLALLAAVVGDSADALGQGGIGGEDGPPVAIAAERLGRKKAGGGDMADGARLATVLLRAEALGRVLDEFQPMLFREGLKRRVVGHLTKEVDSDDGSGARRDGLLDLGGIDIISDRIDVGKDRRGPHQSDGLGRADPGEGCSDDFVAGADPEPAQGHFQGHGAAGDRDAVEGLGRAAEKFSESSLQFVDFRTIDEAAVRHDLGH